jgi:hypothetical protein
VCYSYMFVSAVTVNIPPPQTFPGCFVTVMWCVFHEVATLRFSQQVMIVPRNTCNGYVFTGRYELNC